MLLQCGARGQPPLLLFNLPPFSVSELLTNTTTPSPRGQHQREEARRLSLPQRSLDGRPGLWPKLQRLTGLICTSRGRRRPQRGVNSAHCLVDLSKPLLAALFCAPAHHRSLATDTVGTQIPVTYYGTAPGAVAQRTFSVKRAIISLQDAPSPSADHFVQRNGTVPQGGESTQQRYLFQLLGGPEVPLLSGTRPVWQNRPEHSFLAGSWSSALALRAANGQTFQRQASPPVCLLGSPSRTGSGQRPASL